VNSLATPLATKIGRRMAAALAVAVVAVLPLAQAAPQAKADTSTGNASAAGYWMVGSDGKVYPFGSAADLGSPALPAGARATHIEPTPDGGGYYVLDDRGDVFAFGHAQSLGNAGLNGGESAVSLSATPSGNGYWIFTTAGRVITRGDARNLGDMSGKHLNAPVVSSTVTPDGSGYWMVAADGGVFSFGAPFWGSTGDLKLNKPVEGIVPTLTNKGYWLVASDGGVFAFGDAGFRGSMGGTKLNKPVVGLVRYGNGYLMVAADGGIFAFSDLPFQGSLGAHPPANPIVGTAPVPGGTAGTTPTTTATPTTAPFTPPPYSGPAMFASAPTQSWGTPGDPNKVFTNSNNVPTYPYSQNVDAITEIGTSVFIGGEFQGLTSPTPIDRSNVVAGYNYIAALDTTSGAPVSGPFNTTVKLDGPVRALFRSPDGHRLYVGGEFKHVNGETHGYLIALDPATGQIDRSFNPPVLDAYVNSMAQFGNRLYVGGGFTNAGGDTTRAQLVALDATTGAIDPGFTPPTRYTGAFFTHTGNPIDDPNCTDANVPDPPKGCPATPVSDPSGVVDALAVTADGAYLFVGGNFLHYGTPYDPAQPLSANHQHGGLIAVDPATGALTPWQPISSRPVFGLSIWVGDGKRLFASAGGAGGRLMTFNPGQVDKKGKANPLWVGNVDGDAVAVASTPTAVYLVGHFDHQVTSPDDLCLTQPTPSGGYNCPNGTPNRHLVAFDPNGQLDSQGRLIGKVITDSNNAQVFTAQADTAEGPNAVYIGASQLYVGGNFSHVYSCPAANGCPRFNQPGFAIYGPKV